MKKLLFFIALFPLISIGYGQDRPAAIDTTLLEPRPEEIPFVISDEKRLSDEDLANKREGRYITGVPEARVDPIRGFGIGASAFLFNNKDRSDPFFYYTPYRALYAIELRGTTSGQVEGGLRFDIPFAFNTKWRLRGDLMFQSDPNWQYFGTGTQTLNRLSYIDKITGIRVNNARFRSYEENLVRTREGRGEAFGETEQGPYSDMHYNEIDYSQYLVALALERTFFEGRMRLMFGYELLWLDITHYDGMAIENAVHTQTGEEVAAIQGKTRITEEFNALQRGDPDSYWRRKNISGYNGGRVALFQTGIMWDTRDLEPDPSNGVFVEIAQEFSFPAIGSQFNFSKHLFQAVYYQRLFPEILGRTVLAGRFAFGGIRGSNIPFTEMFDQWSSSEAAGIPVLGGSRSLRGYREYRFTGMVYGWGNLELRSRFFQTNILRQHLALSVVPFYDIGTVWDSLSEVRFGNFRMSPGLGARIAWNQATILRFDLAMSPEDTQFFFVFGHTF